MKYQFCIRFENTTSNSSATKAILDCNKIFSEHDYVDYTITVWDNAKKTKYYWLLIKELYVFYRSIQKGSFVGIQYPLLSINNVFKVFISLTKFKKVKFFCIVHDLESLRSGGNDESLNKREIKNLNFFDQVIVHNSIMLKWLRAKGFTKNAIPLVLFDYLTKNPVVNKSLELKPVVVFAGNLNKSTFVYLLNEISGWNFNIYGPNFNNQLGNSNGNMQWCGEFSPENIVSKLEGSFGLIWDGDRIDQFDEVLGSYLKFNNPHKFSLYIASGLPVIAPNNSAIASIIKEYNIGLLINNLHDLVGLSLDNDDYQTMKSNVSKLREEVINGCFFSRAIEIVEQNFQL